MGLSISVPNGSWYAVQNGNAPNSVWLRDAVSTHGPVGASAIGFTGGYTGGVARRYMESENFGDAIDHAYAEGLWGAGGPAVATGMHPTTWVYWGARRNEQFTSEIQNMRMGGVHHQNNFAQYPAYAMPRLNANRKGMTLLGRFFGGFYGKDIIPGNVEGRFSEYDGDYRAPGCPWRPLG